MYGDVIGLNFMALHRDQVVVDVIRARTNSNVFGV
jgi:hypothetical protein